MGTQLTQALIKIKSNFKPNREDFIDFDSLIKICEAIHKAQSMKRDFPKQVEIVAEEPFLYRYGNRTILDIIEEFHNRGFKIKVTTNGSMIGKYLDKLIGKIDSIRISFHSINEEDFKAITGVNLIKRVKENILAAKKSGLKVTINRVLLEDYLSDMNEFMEFVIENSLRAKLLQLHYTSGNFNNFISDNDLLKLVINEFVLPHTAGQSKMVSDDGMNLKQIFPLQNNAQVVVRLPIGKGIENFEYCRNCSNVNNCRYSNCLLPTSIKLTPDLKLLFCSVKETPFIDLGKINLNKISDDDLAYFLSLEFETLGLSKEKDFYLPIRAIVTKHCNFKCYFCHSEGYKTN